MELEAPIKCPNCNKTHKVKLKNIYPGRSLQCLCGASIKFEGDDMRKAQKELDAFNRIIKNFGK